MAINRTKLILIGALGVTALILLFIPSCSQRTSAKSHEGATATELDPHGLHQLNNQRLREIMRRLSAMNFDGMSIEIDATGALHRDICDVSRMATELAADARVIPLIFKDRDMSDESRRVLDAQSDRLCDEAAELRAYADANDVRMLKVKLDEMIATCNSCHASFRAPALARQGGERERLALLSAGLPESVHESQ